MKNKISYQTIMLIIVLAVSLMTAALLSGCSTMLTRYDKGRGKIVLTLTRGGNEAALSAFGHSGIQLAEFERAGIYPEELPRSVTQVLNTIESYIVRISGGFEESCQLYTFEPGQEEMSISISLPSGNGYSITLLALAAGSSEGEKRLLGAGEQGFAVTAGQTTSVRVLMFPYKYSLEWSETFTPGADLPTSFYILGPLMNEFFALDGEHSRLYYHPTTPETNFNQESRHLPTSPVPLGSENNYDCYQFEAQIPATDDYFDIINEGTTQTYITHLQLEMEVGGEWQGLIADTGLTGITLLLPDFTTGDSLEVVTTTPGGGTVDPPTDNGIITTLAEYPEISGPEGIIVDSVGNLYAAASRVVKIAPDGTITPVAGAESGWGYDETQDGGPATDALLWAAFDVALDKWGNLYIADGGANVIRVVDPGGIIDTFAGTGDSGYNGDNIQATSARLNYPTGVAVDDAGNVYISDTGNNLIRKVDTTGIITTIAGTGTAGFNGDGAALNTQINHPMGIALDGEGNLYFAEYENDIIRKLDTASETLTTVAGGGENLDVDYVGDPTGVQLCGPRDVALDSSGNLYIADCQNWLVRKIEDGIIRTAAGSGQYGTGGDGGPATEAELTSVNSVAVDSSGTIYIADYADVIRKVEYQN